MPRPSRSVVLALCLLGSVPVAEARDVSVATVDALKAATSAAQPGDAIILADGTYAIGGGSWGLSCMTAGTADSPIVVRAANPLAAHLECDVLECIHVEGAYWQVQDLDIKGVCANDSDCEHAFHVVGQGHHFVMRGNRVVDFNAQLKVNADGAHNLPDHGLVEGNELYDTRARTTSNPVTKLNIDNASYWMARDNFIHDFEKGGGDGVSYGAFNKGGSHEPVFERNLVICSLDWSGGGARLGLSFGGGGMGAGMCPPWDGSDCNPETFDGVMRNNIIVNCSDVAIYLNEASNTKILHNTMIATAGVDFRFSTSTGEAHGNVLSSVIRTRDGGSFTGSDNLMNVDSSQFAAWYQDPMRGDLRMQGDLGALIDQGGVTEEVTDDYCARTRVDGHYDWGALEHSLGDCATNPPPGGPPPAETDGGAAPPPDAGTPAPDGGATSDAGGPLPSDGPAAAGDGGQAATGASGGCGCRTTARGQLLPALLGLCLVLAARRRGPR